MNWWRPVWFFDHSWGASRVLTTNYSVDSFWPLIYWKLGLKYHIPTTNLEWKRRSTKIIMNAGPKCIELNYACYEYVVKLFHTNRKLVGTICCLLLFWLFEYIHYFVYEWVISFCHLLLVYIGRMSILNLLMAFWLSYRRFQVSGSNSYYYYF